MTYLDIYFTTKKYINFFNYCGHGETTLPPKGGGGFPKFIKYMGKKLKNLIILTVY